MGLMPPPPPSPPSPSSVLYFLLTFSFFFFLLSFFLLLFFSPLFFSGKDGANASAMEVQFVPLGSIARQGRERLLTLAFDHEFQILCAQVRRERR